MYVTQNNRFKHVKRHYITSYRIGIKIVKRYIGYETAYIQFIDKNQVTRYD